MTPLERVHAGIIGCGRISGLHALGYQDHPHAEIVEVRLDEIGFVQLTGNLATTRRGVA